MTKKQKEQPGEVVLAALNRLVRVGENGKQVEVSAFEAAFQVCTDKALRGDDRAAAVHEQILQLSGHYEPEPDTSKTGVIVMYAPSSSREEWLREADAMKQTANPLEGIPGAEEFTMDRKFGEDPDRDPTGN